MVRYLNKPMIKVKVTNVQGELVAEEENPSTESKNPPQAFVPLTWIC